MTDSPSLPGARKRKAIRPVIAAQQARADKRAAERRCFWTRPLGHFRGKNGICVNCGHDAEWGCW